MLESYYDKENYLALSMKHHRKEKLKHYDNDKENNVETKIFSKHLDEGFLSCASKTQGLIKSLKDLSLVGSDEPRSKSKARKSRWSRPDTETQDSSASSGSQGNDSIKSDWSSTCKSTTSIDSYLLEIFYSDDKSMKKDVPRKLRGLSKAASPRSTSVPYSKRSSSSHCKNTSSASSSNTSTSIHHQQSRRRKYDIKSNHTTSYPSNDIRSYFQKMETSDDSAADSTAKENSAISFSKHVPMEIVQRTTTVSSNVEMKNVETIEPSSNPHQFSLLSDGNDFISPSSACVPAKLEKSLICKTAAYPMEISYNNINQNQTIIKTKLATQANTKISETVNNSKIHMSKKKTLVTECKTVFDRDGENSITTNIEKPFQVTAMKSTASEDTQSGNIIELKNNVEIPCKGGGTSGDKAKCINSTEVSTLNVQSSDDLLAAPTQTVKNANYETKIDASGGSARKILKPIYHGLRRCNSLIEMPTTSRRYFSTPISVKRSKLRTTVTEPRNKRKIDLKDLFDSDDERCGGSGSKSCPKRYRNAKDPQETVDKLPKIPLFMLNSTLCCYADADLGVSPLGYEKECTSSCTPGLTESYKNAADNDVTLCDTCGVRWNHYRYRCPRCWCGPAKDTNKSAPSSHCSSCEKFNTPSKKKYKALKRYATCLY